MLNLFKKLFSVKLIEFLYKWNTFIEKKFLLYFRRLKNVKFYGFTCENYLCESEERVYLVDRKGGGRVDSENFYLYIKVLFYRKFYRSKERYS